MSANPANLLNETLIGLKDVARRLPSGRRGRPVSFGCVLRWITRGAPGLDGRRVKLEAIRVGGRWLTSVEALTRWSESLTPCLDREPFSKFRTTLQRSKATERALKQLEKAGL